MPRNGPTDQKVVVIGAGMGGLASALELSARGFEVEVVERLPGPGGKMRQVAAGDAQVDGGPTILTMRWVFEDLLRAVGSRLEDHVSMTPLEVLGRNAWDYGDRGQSLDMFADPKRTEEAIGDFAGAAEAKGYRNLLADSERTFRALDHTFMQASRPSMPGLIRRAGPSILRTKPFDTMWSVLGKYFRDPRLHQLFGRYSVYCGSSPYHATAVLMLMLHVEQSGVWSVDGGMHALARGLAALAESRGVTFHYGRGVKTIEVSGGRATGVRLDDDSRIEADAVVFNGEVNALASGLLGPEVTGAVPPVPQRARSLSLLAVTMNARAEGFPLSRHNVFYGADYKGEFRDIFERNRLPAEPTTYICAQDRMDGTDQDAAPSGAERLLLLINAPPTGDTASPSLDRAEIDACLHRSHALLERCGLTVHPDPDSVTITSPREFEHLFPASGGSLYGRASHGWQASFTRPGARTKVPGLYVAGGSVHPGPGIPMATLSGRQAASSILTDLRSTSRSPRVVMAGGMSTA
ncbi:1-hydroxycarotenoid 3,4-desaturase CrtD [Rhodospira trueperi]|uniref:1-hydroxycarotenoid 3,4-desaturase n=1 Tax=Rhodospira trueperi TaxID=69960 RepID=A0A1G6ZVM9_9PROT|nr:1-hydroxycarotenoid 3,4-desaturase CrtD [Rhodospira trueperi]SDE06784.1 1-hydroxycarotenoid 3,4-desaturase [Rhodospira trueperi]